MHVEERVAALDQVRRFAGPVGDVGSGGGAPGLPVAAALPEREVTLLEASARKAAFLERAAAEFPNVRIIRGRAEEQPVDAYGVALAKALAPPPVALEWCLPLVVPGGAVILYVGSSVEIEPLARVASLLGGGGPELTDGILVVPKRDPTPPGFPRRPGMARKRPLA